MLLDNWEQTCVVVTCPYGNGTPFEDNRIGSPKQGVILPLLCMDPNCYTTAKLNERELCTVQNFCSVQILNLKCSRPISKTHSNNCSCDFFRFRQNVDPMCIESLDKECTLGGY